MMNTKSNFRPAQPIDNSIVPLVQRPEYAEPMEELQELEALYAKKEAERKRLLARARGEKTKRTAAERAVDLLKGGRVDPTMPGPAIEAIDEELLILRQAISEKTRVLDSVSADFSYEESQKLRPQYDEAMREALSAMGALAVAVGAVAGLQDRLRGAGYRPSSSVVFPDVLPAAATALGSPDVGFSQAWRFRRALEDMGII